MSRLVATDLDGTLLRSDGSVSDLSRGVLVALERLATELGHGPEEVVAFGDMPNDLPMLSWAGTSSAVANADPLVLEAADHVAPANDEDGVARTLARLFDVPLPLG